MPSRWVRDALSSPWTAGEIAAAATIILLGVPITFILLVQIGSVFASALEYLWDGAGGNSADLTQVSMARAAWAGVFVGAVTIVFLAFTVVYTHLSTRIALISTRQTRLLGQQQMRAYISVVDLTIAFVPYRSGNYFYVPPTIMVELRNTGQTPARQVRIRFGWQNYRPDRPSAVVLSEPHSSFEIGAGVSVQEQVPCYDFVGNELSRALYADQPSWVHGVISYEDVFGDTWSTHFLREIRLEFRGDEVHGIVSVPERGNYST